MWFVFLISLHNCLYYIYYRKWCGPQNNSFIWSLKSRWLSARCLVLWSRINDLLLFFNKFEAHLQCFKVYFYTTYVMISLLYVLAQFRFQWYFYQDKTSFNLFSLRLNRCIIIIKHSVYADWCPKIILIIRKTIYTVKILLIRLSIDRKHHII